MPLENIQYDAIMREYGRRQLLSRHRLEEHRAHAQERIPRLKEIQDAIASASAQQIHSLLGGEIAGYGAHRDLHAGCRPQRQTCIRARAFSMPDYLEAAYECPACRDTGYVNGQKCTCFHKLAADQFRQQYSLDQILERENFALFSFSLSLIHI